MFYSNGAIYEGEFKNGRKEGIGKHITNQGWIYEGEWKKGKKNGNGKFTNFPLIYINITLHR